MNERAQAFQLSNQLTERLGRLGLPGQLERVDEAERRSRGLQGRT